jgi:hypothetical protein
MGISAMHTIHPISKIFFLFFISVKGKECKHKFKRRYSEIVAAGFGGFSGF